MDTGMGGKGEREEEVDEWKEKVKRLERRVERKEERGIILF